MQVDPPEALWKYSLFVFIAGGVMVPGGIWAVMWLIAGVQDFMEIP